MQQVLLATHVLICIGLVGLVLIQHGKGANMGALFGSSSGNMFGSQATTSFLVKLTTWFAVAFFASSLLLGYMSMTKKGEAGTIINTSNLAAPSPVDLVSPVERVAK